ncbi:hypothetical protein [Hymenobacter sp. BT730]|uniref:hypothetical protein n=1 Tax=Hymenobacter sp. BT730 TaxID=3063332 RepID=UPI0026E072ED|nr:hypothetical protein [Hymenobacter sp. BT730]
MADINIQRKKKSLSPWLAVLLALVVLGLIWFFFFRADPEQPVDAIPPTNTTQPLGATSDTSAAADTKAMEDMANEVAATPEAFYAFATDSARSVTDYGRRGLHLLTGVLVSLADRDDLRQDPTVQERRNDLTSATSRLEEPGTSLRPGFTATAAMLQAIQQKAYPEQAAPVNRLTKQADALSGRDEPAQQEMQRAFFSQAAQILKSFS